MIATQRGTTQTRTSRVLRAATGALAVVVGVIAIALGAVLFLAAQAANPVPVDGTIANYQAVLVGGSYSHSELTLVGDQRTYTFNRGSFSPALPDRLYQNGPVTVWTDGNGGPVIALTLSDEHGVNATTYGTLAYSDPTAPLWLGRGEGIAAALVGLALAAGVPFLLRRGGVRKPIKAGKAASQFASQSADAEATDRQAAVEMPVVSISRPDVPAPIAAAVAGAALPQGPTYATPDASLPRWGATAPSGSFWDVADPLAGPTPGAPRVERSIPTFPSASSSSADVRPPGIDDLPTARTPALSSPQLARPTNVAGAPVASPAERPPGAPPGGPDASIPGSLLAPPRYGPGGPSAGADAGGYVSGRPWQGHMPAVPDPASGRPNTRLVPSGGPGATVPRGAPSGPIPPDPRAAGRDVTDAPTAPTPSIVPPEASEPAPRTPLWPPARDTNGQ